MPNEQLWGIVAPDGRRWVVWGESKPIAGLGLSVDDGSDNEEAYFEAGTYTVLDEPFASTDAADAWIERRGE